MHTNIQPYSLASGEGSALWFLGALTYVKATGEMTRGGLRRIYLHTKST
jgi:hypothetical protein